MIDVKKTDGLYSNSYVVHDIHKSIEFHRKVTSSRRNKTKWRKRKRTHAQREHEGSVIEQMRHASYVDEDLDRDEVAGARVRSVY